MDASFRPGDRVLIRVDWVMGCPPGATGRVVAFLNPPGGYPHYRVKVDPPCPADEVEVYQSEIEREE
jgi:hypothetical protein